MKHLTQNSWSTKNWSFQNSFVSEKRKQNVFIFFLLNKYLRYHSYLIYLQELSMVIKIWQLHLRKKISIPTKRSYQITLGNGIFSNPTRYGWAKAFISFQLSKKSKILIVSINSPAPLNYSKVFVKFLLNKSKSVLLVKFNKFSLWVSR